MASLSTCHLGLWLGWQILLNLVKLHHNRCADSGLVSPTQNTAPSECSKVFVHVCACGAVCGDVCACGAGT